MVTLAFQLHEQMRMVRPINQRFYSRPTAAVAKVMNYTTIHALLVLLKKLEWSGKGRAYDYGDFEEVCRVCYGGFHNGERKHEDWCELNAVIVALEKELLEGTKSKSVPEEPEILFPLEPCTIDEGKIIVGIK